MCEQEGKVHGQGDQVSECITLILGSRGPGPLHIVIVVSAPAPAAVITIHISAAVRSDGKYFLDIKIF